jgi:hypothetical protein
MNTEGTRIKPEGLPNVNAGMIMLTCFVFAHISGKLPSGLFLIKKEVLNILCPLL